MTLERGKYEQGLRKEYTQLTGDFEIIVAALNHSARESSIGDALRRKRFEAARQHDGPLAGAEADDELLSGRRRGWAVIPLRLKFVAD